VLKHIKSTEQWDQKSLGAKGFTLIELLVVIVILGILAAVVVFAVSGINNNSQESACKTDKRTLRTAAEAYIAQEDPSGPVTEAQLVTANFLSEASTLYDVDIDANQNVSIDVEDTDCNAWP
jgi:prepilin-type N-terminal cleavage/methylation domain-containing protein